MQEKVQKIHNIILENRKNLTLSGVKKIENYDEDSIVLSTEMGDLTIKGEKLDISKMDVELGDIRIDGKIFGLVYNDNLKGTSIFKRLFK